MTRLLAPTRGPHLRQGGTSSHHVRRPQPPRFPLTQPRHKVLARHKAFAFEDQEVKRITPSLPEVVEGTGARGNIQVRNGDDGGGERGLWCTQPTEEGAVLLRVPLKWALVVRGDDNAQKEPPADSHVLAVQALWEVANGKLPEVVKAVVNAGVLEQRWRLAMYVLWVCRSPQSHVGAVWSRHAKLLPAGDDCVLPMLWDAAELEQLQDAGLQASIAAAAEQATSSFSAFLSSWELGPELKQALGGAEPHDFLWAMAIVRSRALGDTLGTESAAMIVPWADMANHTTDAACSGAVNMDSNAFELDAFRAGGLAAGDEATVSYGDSTTNAGLMEKYGFSVKQNPNDRVFFADSPTDVPLAELELDAARFTAVVRAFTEANGEEARAAAIVASLPTGLPAEAEKAAPGFALTEAARSQALAVRLNQLLDSFPTTVEEDEQLLAENLNSRLRAAVSYRLERKLLVRMARDALLMYSSVVSPGP